PRAKEHGSHRAEQIGDAGEVGEDVVAVEAHDGEQLVGDLEVLDDDQQQQRLEPGAEVDRGSDEAGDGIEIDAAQVGPQPTGPAEPVGVGDVGVEGGPHDVQAGTDGAGAPPTVTTGGGVAPFVEQRAGDGQRE